MNVGNICPQCDAEIGKPHHTGCLVEQCSVCGGQYVSCRCKGHEPEKAAWTGQWPILASNKLEDLIADVLDQVSDLDDHLEKLAVAAELGWDEADYYDECFYEEEDDAWYPIDGSDRSIVDHAMAFIEEHLLTFNEVVSAEACLRD
jgi:hypothetical protein